MALGDMKEDLDDQTQWTNHSDRNMVTCYLAFEDVFRLSLVGRGWPVIIRRIHCYIVTTVQA